MSDGQDARAVRRGNTVEALGEVRVKSAETRSQGNRLET
jgi:hypothetical protein